MFVVQNFTTLNSILRQEVTFKRNTQKESKEMPITYKHP